MPSESEKPARRMSCWNCPRYSRTDRRCREGKANPKRKSDAITVAEILGVRTLCHYNPFREPLAMRMFFPTATATRRATAEARRVAREKARTYEARSARTSPDGCYPPPPEPAS